MLHDGNLTRFPNHAYSGSACHVVRGFEHTGPGAMGQRALISSLLVAECEACPENIFSRGTSKTVLPRLWPTEPTTSFIPKAVLSFIALSLGRCFEPRSDTFPVGLQRSCVS